jgi:hypothetical protein
MSRFILVSLVGIRLAHLQHMEFAPTMHTLELYINRATATTVRTATRASIATPVTWQYRLRTAALTTGAYPIATPQMHIVWIL